VAKRVFAVLLTVLCCLPVLSGKTFAFESSKPGEVAEWNGPFEHETLAFYFPDPDVPELAVRGVRKKEIVIFTDDEHYPYSYYWEFFSAPIVVIPDEVEGYPVTAVGWEVLAFQNEVEEREIGLECIYVGKNVHILGKNAFAGRKVIIGKNELIAVHDLDSTEYDPKSKPFTCGYVHCYLDSDAYRLAQESGAVIDLIDESHLVSDVVKIDEDLNVYLPWGVTKETLTDYVSVDGGAHIRVSGDTIEDGTQIELVNSTYGTVDNTYTVVLEKPQITLTVDAQRTVFAKTSFRLDAAVQTTGSPCTLTYSSDRPDVAAVDDSGVVTTLKSGAAAITVTASDRYGFSQSAVCTVTVRYDWWQWLIRIFLFGWLWY